MKDTPGQSFITAFQMARHTRLGTVEAGFNPAGIVFDCTPFHRRMAGGADKEKINGQGHGENGINDFLLGGHLKLL